MNRLYILLFGLMLVFAGCLGSQDCSGGPVCGEDGKTYPNKCLAADAGVTISSEGACRPACDDPDGRDIFNAGGVFSDGKTYTDVCVDRTAVKEYYCEDGSANHVEVSCPPGYACASGKCAESPCTDSDGGSKPDVKGTVVSGSDTNTDSCKDAGTVTEYYCDGGSAKSKSMECASGSRCLDGACVEGSCSDTDGGDDQYVAGSVTKADISQADKCLSPTKLTEYYCEGNDVRSKAVTCESGFECKDGACLELPKCVDSDNGKDKFTKGTVTTPSNSYVDDCYSSTQVLEYYCDGESVESEKLACGTGYECKLGKCTELECVKETDNFDNRDIRYEIENFGSSEKLRMYVGDLVELNDDIILRLYSVSGTDATFRLYLDYDDFKDSDLECSDTIAEGDILNDMCGENTGDIEVDLVNDSEEFADVFIDEFFVTQYYSEEGSLADWTDKSACPDDELLYADYDSYFYPHLDTESAELNLDGSNFRLFNRSAELLSIDAGSETIEFDFEGDNFELEDGDTFEYEGVDYEMRLYFNDGGGLIRIHVQLD